jgi:predicted Holliday junction resolvase-like endonuclease
MEFLSIVNSLGPTALIILLLVIVIMQLKQYREDVRSVKGWVATQQEEQKKRDQEQDDRIAYLQQHTVSKEDMYQQFGGWRTELATVNQNILHLTELVTKSEKKG